MHFSELSVLNPAEIEVLHQRSVRILEQAGVRVLDDACRAALVKAGGKTAPNHETVFLPEGLIRDCLATAPSRFFLYRQDAALVEIGTDTRVFGSLVINPWIMDYATQTPRRPTMADVVRHTRLGDALDNVGFLYRMDMPPSDADPDTGYIRTLEACAVNTVKPFLAAPATLESLHHWLEVGEILADGSSMAERPRLALGAPVTTPLTFNPINGRIVREGVARGLPICGQTEPIAGTTAPLSLWPGTTGCRSRARRWAAWSAGTIRSMGLKTPCSCSRWSWAAEACSMAWGPATTPADCRRK